MSMFIHKMKLPLPIELVEAALDLYRATGIRLYVAGGYIRDYFMSIPSHDIDLTTPDRPGIVKYFGADLVRPHPSGNIWAPMFFSVDCSTYNPQTYELSQFKTDKYDSDGHVSMCPSTDPQEDIMRRDFTINAALYDIVEQTIMAPDTFLQDVLDRRVFFVGNADQRIREDPGRMFRAIRFCSRISKVRKIPEETLGAILRNSALQTKVPQELKTTEFRKSFLTITEGQPCLPRYLPLGLWELSKLDIIPANIINPENVIWRGNTMLEFMRMNLNSMVNKMSMRKKRELLSGTLKLSRKEANYVISRI